MIRHLLKLVWNRKRANALIVAEMFFSFLVVFAVLTGAITFLRGWSEPLGYDWRNVLDVSLNFEADRRAGASKETQAAVLRMLDEARNMPEVESAALAITPPYAFSTAETSRNWRGGVVSFLWDDVTDEYAEVMKIPVLKGRWFSAADDASPMQPVVLDANAAEMLYGDEDPVGKIMEGDDSDKPVRIVGVVAPFRKDGETSSPMKMVFRRFSPTGAYGTLGSELVVRVRPGTPAAFEEHLSRRLQQVAPEIGISVRPMSQMRERMSRMKFAPLVVAGTIGLFLVLMVALGLTGVLWQNVTKRTRELGLRRAMGASGASVHRQVLGEVALLATFALVAGSIVVLQFPMLGIFKFVTKGAFTAAFISALATIYALTVLCGLYPSWLASRLQPADALRYE